MCLCVNHITHPNICKSPHNQTAFSMSYLLSSPFARSHLTCAAASDDVGNYFGMGEVEYFFLKNNFMTMTVTTTVGAGLGEAAVDPSLEQGTVVRLQFGDNCL